jgi:hypothetical protein
MAMEAEFWFGKKMKKFPPTQGEEWTRQMQKVFRNLVELLSHPPAELDPSGNLSAAADSEDEDSQTDDE